jgi:hypothetical protein
VVGVDPSELEAAVDLGLDGDRVCVEVHDNSWCLLPVGGSLPARSTFVG